MSNDPDCYVVIIGINDLEIEVDDIGPGTLGDGPYGRLGDDIAHRQTFGPIGTLPNLNFMAIMRRNDQIAFRSEYSSFSISSQSKS